MSIEVKICGISTPDAMTAAVESGARYVGLVFYSQSPRTIEPQLAAQLARMAPTGIRVVGLFVDPTDETIEQVIGQVPLDLIQLHGEESLARTAEISRNFPLPIIKAIRVREKNDLLSVGAYAEISDMLLFDARPPDNVASLPGGNAISFDWSLLEGVEINVPWMLAGGLNIANLHQAVHESGARIVDVSSGVEDRPGHKDPEMIRNFLETAHNM